MAIFNSWIRSLESAGWDLPLILAVIVTSITTVLLYTRLTSGSTPKNLHRQGQPPPTLAFWIPLLGHLPRILLDFENLLLDSKQSFSTGIFSIYLGREIHHILCAPKIVKTLLATNSNDVETVSASKRSATRVFGVPKDQTDAFHYLVPELDVSLASILEEKLEDPDILRRFQGNLVDLVTFNSSMIDQEPWERVSAQAGTSDGDVVEASLLPLTFVFLTHMATSTFLTENLFFETDHHDVAPMLLALAQSYPLLITGIPRTVPHPALPAAYVGRNKLVSRCDAMMDLCSDEELQGEVFAAYDKIYEKQNVSAGIRSAHLLRTLYELNSSHALAFWMLANIIQDVGMLQRVRAEVAGVVKVVQNPPMLGFSVPPRVTIDSKTLQSSKLPLLEACFLETVRLYSRGEDVCTAKRDFVLEGDLGGVFKDADQWEIKKGAWVAVNHWLINTDLANWDDPLEWRPERHLKAASMNGEEAEKRASFASHQRNVNGKINAASKLFALAFVAGVVSLYNVEHSNELPKAQNAGSVALPQTDLRVRFRKMKLHHSS